MALEIIKGIDEFTTRAQIRDIFEEFGEVDICSLPPTDARDREPGAICFVQDSDARKALEACKAGQVRLKGKQLRVRLKSDGEQRSPSELPPLARGQNFAGGSNGGTTRPPAHARGKYDGLSESRSPSPAARRRQPARTVTTRPRSDSRSFPPQKHSAGKDRPLRDRRAPVRDMRDTGRSDVHFSSSRARSRSWSGKGYSRRDDYDDEPRDRDRDKGKGKGAGKERRFGDWDCPRCGVMVFASKDECFSCGELKPRSAGGRNIMKDDNTGDRGKGLPKGQERRYNDWDCPNCGSVVYGSKDRCFSCGEPKPERLREKGGDHKGKGKGGRDWDCPACGKLVFSYKEQCFSCGEPRPRNERRRSESRSRSRDEERTFTGKVCRVHEERGTAGYTFISCHEASRIYGKDIFLHFSSNPDAQHLREGDSVMFNVKMSDKGRPESINGRPVDQGAANRTNTHRSRQRSLGRDDDRKGHQDSARNAEGRDDSEAKATHDDGGDAEDAALVAEFDPYMDDPADDSASKSKPLLLEIKNFFVSPKEKDTAADLVRQLKPTLQMLVAYDPSQGDPVVNASMPSSDRCLMELQSEALVKCAVPMLHNLALKGKKLQVKAVEKGSE